MCGSTSKESKKNTELTELPRLQPVSLENKGID